MTDDALTQLLLDDDDLAALLNVTDTADDAVVGSALVGPMAGQFSADELAQLDDDVLTVYDILGINRDERRSERNAVESDDE